MTDIFAWLFGVGAMCSLFLAYQQKKRIRLIACKLSADIFWVGHYFLLGGYGGMVPNLVGIFRELVFTQRGKKKWASHAFVPILFILLNWGIGIFTFTRPINILPIAASTFVTVSLWVREPRLTKAISVPVSLTFLVYDIAIGSLIGAVNESLAILSIILSFIKRRKTVKKSIFTPDIPTDKPEVVIPKEKLENPAATLLVADAAPAVFEKGERFAEEIAERFFADFENKETDKMVHVSTFKMIGGNVYMSYYANTAGDEEDPHHQTARFVFCPEGEPENITFFDILTVGDEICGEPVSLVYDTIFAEIDENTVYILWTAKVGDRYYRLYRPFYVKEKKLGEIGVNRFTVGGVTNDFSTTGMVAAFAANDMAHKVMYSDIGIMQKFTTRVENGTTYYYTGAYSGDLNMIVKSRDFITWEFVAAPDFPTASKWENATYVIGDLVYYFVRQHDEEKCGFLTVYDLEKKTWTQPVLIEDCQSRSDFIVYQGELYLVNAPIDREHIGIVRIDQSDIRKSAFVLIADMHGSCFYPYVTYLRGGELAMSYTVSRKHIRLAEFTLSNYLD